MKEIIIGISLLTFSMARSQVKTVSADKNWSNRDETVINSMEADIIVRLGDVDNLGFGWPEGFDPFCGMMTQAHAYPWEADIKELPGFDRILLSSKFKTGNNGKCGGDGYSGSYH